MTGVKIVDNIIVYPNHVVICNPDKVTDGYLKDVRFALLDDGSSEDHRRQLSDSLHPTDWIVKDRDGAWTLENGIWVLIPAPTIEGIQS